MQWPLTAKTIGDYEGPPLPLPLTPGEWGPLYHVTRRDLGIGPSDCERVEAYKKYARYSRLETLKAFCQKEAINTKLAEVFLESHKDRIEMDPEFALFPYFEKFFPENKREEAKDKFCKTSEERWCGLTQPKDFNEADRLYALSHLRQEPALYLYEIRLWVSSREGERPEVLVGKVRGGTSLQLKLNNHAIEFVWRVTPVDKWNMPQGGAEKK